MSGVSSNPKLPMVIAGQPVQGLTEQIETQQRQTAMLRAQEESNARYAADEPNRQKVLAQFGPSFGFDQRRARTSLLGVG